MIGVLGACVGLTSGLCFFFTFLHLESKNVNDFVMTANSKNHMLEYRGSNKLQGIGPQLSMYHHNGVCTLLMGTILAAVILRLPLLMKMKWTDKYYNSNFNNLLHMLTVPPPLKHVHALVIENHFIKFT